MRRRASSHGRPTGRLAAATIVAIVASFWLMDAGAGVAAFQPVPGGRIDGRLGQVERCDDFFVGSLLSPLGDLFPGLGAIPLLGRLFHDNDVPDAAHVLVRSGNPDPTTRFRNATGVIKESEFIGDYPGGFPDRYPGVPDNHRGPLGDEAVVNFEDYPDVHDSHDMNFYLRLDNNPAQADIISTFGIDSQGRKPGESGYAPDTLEVEWETGILTSSRVGDGRFFPKWAWPVPGDRIWVNGYWIFDCGHTVENESTGEKGLRSEIHPPRALAAMRERVKTPPGATQPITVMEADVYVHGRAGIMTDILVCGGRVIMDNRDCPTRTGETPRGSDSSDGNPDHDIALDHLGAPINENFHFTICTPPLPPGVSADAVVKWHEPVSPHNTVFISPDLTVQNATGPCADPENHYGPKEVLVTIPLGGTSVTPDSVYARRIYVGWAAPPQRLRGVRLTLNSMFLDDDLDDVILFGEDDCECAWFWTTIDKANNKTIRLSDVADDPEHHMNDFRNDTSMNFINATWDVVVPANQSFTLRTFGYDGGVGEGSNDPKQDCYDDHFGHHDFGDHVDLGLGDLPDLCIAAVALFDKQDMNDDPFDILKHEFTSAEIDSLLGSWPSAGSATVTLRSPHRCEVTYQLIGSTFPLFKKVTCESEAQVQAAFEASGFFHVTHVHEYEQYDLNFTIEAVPTDSDGDGLNDGDEVNVHGTNPLDADTDDDGLTDGAEVNTHHTNPLDADTDDDGLTDGAEVNTHHTDPLDPDTDDDGLLDGVEVTVGTNPLDPDSDDDGILDGRDPDFVALAIKALPQSAFKGVGNRDSILAILDAAEGWVATGNIARALRGLRQLRGYTDGCGAAADVTDWIVDCAAQLQIRSLIDVLIANLGG